MDRCRWCRLCHPVTQEVLHTFPTCFVLQMQPLRGLALWRCRFAQRAEAETARFAFPETSTVVPFLVAALAPHSVSFADGPVLKFVLHATVIQTFRVGDRVRQRAGKEAGGRRGSATGGGASGGAAGVSGIGGALSVGFQKSVENPAAIACVSSTCMLICETSRQSMLCRGRGVCGSSRFVHVLRHAKKPESCRYPVFFRKYGLPHKHVPSSPPFWSVVRSFARKSECKVPFLVYADDENCRDPDQQPCPSPPWTDARTALAIVTSFSFASRCIFAIHSVGSSAGLESGSPKSMLRSKSSAPCSSSCCARCCVTWSVPRLSELDVPSRSLSWGGVGWGGVGWGGVVCGEW